MSLPRSPISIHFSFHVGERWPTGKPPQEMRRKGLEEWQLRSRLIIYDLEEMGRTRRVNLCV